MGWSVYFYKQNFKDWTKLKGLDKPEKMNPLNNLHSNACPIMNKTSYNDCFGAKSNDPLDKELEDLLKSKRDKNQKFSFDKILNIVCLGTHSHQIFEAPLKQKTKLNLSHMQFHKFLKEWQKKIGLWEIKNT